MSAAVSGPHRQDAIAERDRFGRLARARELILGVQDGLHLPLAVVTGLASANVAKTRSSWPDGRGGGGRDRQSDGGVPRRPS